MVVAIVYARSNVRAWREPRFLATGFRISTRELGCPSVGGSETDVKTSFVTQLRVITSYMGEPLRNQGLGVGQGHFCCFALGCAGRFVL